MQHYTEPLVEEAQYYPFGLTMAGISSKAFGRLENKIKFNGYEENKTFDLNWLESFYRTYDPQLGRFWQLDPKPTDFESLYVAMGNNPIVNSDYLGDTSVKRVDGKMHDVYSGIFTTFNGSAYKIKGSSKTVQPAAGTLRSFTITGDNVIDGAAVFTAIFNKETGEFKGYAWEKNISYTYEDFINDAINDLAEQYAQADNPLYQHYDNAEDARKSILGTSIGLVIPNPLFKSATSAANGAKGMMRNVDDVMSNPSLLKGESYAYVRATLGKSEGWVNSTMNKTRGTDKGWVLREVNSKGQQTGKLIQYHPGTHRHFGGAPYWKIADGINKPIRYPAGN